MIFVANLSVCAALFLHALSHPPDRWAAADRQRGSWLWMLGLSGVIMITSPVLVPAYVFGVMPRLGNRAKGTDSRYLHR